MDFHRLVLCCAVFVWLSMAVCASYIVCWGFSFLKIFPFRKILLNYLYRKVY